MFSGAAPKYISQSEYVRSGGLRNLRRDPGLAYAILASVNLARRSRQYPASTLCRGSAARCNDTKNFFTFLSNRLSPIWSVYTSMSV